MDQQRSRARPAVHFTTDEGWLNDPHGIIWSGERYHLFYQCVPGTTEWAPGCQWGHATSPDLVHWRAEPPALSPVEGEVGCWSGASVDVGGELQLFYTRPAPDDWGHGAVVRARPDADRVHWHADPVEPLVEPPADLDLANFRDPCIFWHVDHWVMVVGAGTRDGRGLVVHYTSTDLVTWAGGDILCERPSHERDPMWTGEMWECPQLFPLGDTWVLVISVWGRDRLHHMVAATGEYDGAHFTPARWQQLTSGDSAYAMTSFVDRAGRRCVMAWLREGPAFDPRAAVRAGAHSLAYVVSLAVDGTLGVTPHPDVELLRAGRVEPVNVVGGLGFQPLGAMDLAFTGGPGARLTIEVGGTETVTCPVDGPHRVIVDADIVVLSSGSGLTAHRIPAHRIVDPAGRVQVTLTGDVVDVSGWALASAWPGS